MPAVQLCGEDALLGGAAGFGEGGVFGGGIGEQECHVRLFASTLAVLAPRPAARPALTLLEFLLGPADAALSGHILFGVVDPTDELVARQGGDVLPSRQGRRIGKQRLAQVCGQLVHHSAGHPVAAHGRQRNPEHGR